MKYKIGEFSKLVNIPVKTLRYYDEIGLFKPKEVDIFSNYRYYLDSQIADIKLIMELKSCGFTLEDIKKYWNNWSDIILLNQKEKVYQEQQELENRIRKLDEIRLRVKDGIIYNTQNDVIMKRERRKK